MCKQKTIGVIPARLNSSRFPGKLLHEVLGKTVLQRTYERAKMCLEDVFIATDSEKIQSHAKTFNAPTILTTNCINGTERIIQALHRSKRLNHADILINIQGDHPLIDPKTISKTLDILKNDSANVSTAATLIKKREEITSPHIVKVVFDKFQNALYFSRAAIPHKSTIAYCHVGIYAYKTAFLKKLSLLGNTFCQLSEDLEQLKILEHGFKIKVAIVDELPLGVDIKEDLLKVKEFICR